MNIDHLPEPPPGATVRDSNGHEWRRDGFTFPDPWPWSDFLWWGCLACDDDTRSVTAWTWELVLCDTYDSTLTVEMPKL